jgi:hypothetical protein
MGGDYREATATLERDPDFKTAHTADALKKAGAKEIKVGNRDAWSMPVKKDGMDGFTKIIVPLGEDTALIVVGIGAAHKTFPNELAAAFDPDKCIAAVKAPPRTDFTRKLEDFKALKKGMSFREVESWLGPADAAVGNGNHLMEYKLPDKSRVLLGYPKDDKLESVKHEKDGQAVELLK